MLGKEIGRKIGIFSTDVFPLLICMSFNNRCLEISEIIKATMNVAEVIDRLCSAREKFDRRIENVPEENSKLSWEQQIYYDTHFPRYSAYAPRSSIFDNQQTTFIPHTIIDHEEIAIIDPSDDQLGEIRSVIEDIITHIELVNIRDANRPPFFGLA